MLLEDVGRSVWEDVVGDRCELVLERWEGERGKSVGRGIWGTTNKATGGQEGKRWSGMWKLVDYEEMRMRGRDGTSWTICCGAKEVGTSIHVMSSGGSWVAAAMSEAAECAE